MAGRLKGKVAVVTGAAPRGEGVGNGMATALMFAREGAKVVLVNRSAERADKLAQQIKEEGGEAWLVNAHIPEYASGNRFNHEPRRPRKLLLHRKQISKLIGAIQREGRTVVPLLVYFNPRGRAKIEIALVTGKQAHDKRQAIKDRDWQRQRARLLSARR